MSHSSSSSISTSYSRSSKRYNHNSYDDKDGHYKVVLNTEFTNRYIIKELLGQGTFGKVVKAYDKETKSECAIKIIRAIKKYRDASQIEIRVLKTIKDRDPGNLRNCIHLIDCFDYRRHICMVFELLDQSVFDFLKENNFHPFPIKHIQDFAYQLLTSVEFIHSLKLIHTDLKPENIMIVDNKSKIISYIDDKTKKKKKIKELYSTNIQLIDFGSATFQDEYHSSVVSTRHYRAPEIILNLGWSYPCDIWSVGCILIEFFTGSALFQTHDNLEHLAMMEKVLGPIPNHLRVHNEYTKDIFLSNGDLNYPNDKTTTDSKKYVKSIKPLNKIIPSTNKFYELFYDLVEKLLIYDPRKRITAHEAKKHEFFKYKPEEEQNQDQN
ncbi:kinase-like protein [Anaeromyces robustus]|uniref:Kinase-like protein n=1 Tax=Anaeromyces robustus TaxID=1754192 RepID=A0A1Y1WAH4_9FUNG|nr:kinase-like protein [Anaeromyces robustus]|eukprot:ORX70375.1 kinase-like protein [Anaeromyces robustus]